MSKKNYSAELLKMEGVQIEKLEETIKEIVIQLSLQRKEQTCKLCGGKTARVHDYRIRQVRDLELRGKPLLLLYRQRRYACPTCGKRFSERNDFVGRYMRFTHRTGEKIMGLLRRRSSMKDIARDTGISGSGVQRVLRIMPVSKPQRLPEAKSFDEFKGNTDGQRFQCIVTTPLNHRVFDILPARTVGMIQDYLLSFPNRNEVKYVVMDKPDHFTVRQYAKFKLAAGNIYSKSVFSLSDLIGWTKKALRGLQARYEGRKNLCRNRRLPHFTND